MDNHKGCQECTRLWDEYSRLTHQQFRLEGKLKLAFLQYEHSAAKELAAEVERVISRKAELSEAIVRHDAEPHADSIGAGE